MRIRFLTIKSPLAALQMALGDVSAVPEDTRLLIRAAVGRVKDISNNLAEGNLLLNGSNFETTESRSKACFRLSSLFLLSSLIEPSFNASHCLKIGIEVHLNYLLRHMASLPTFSLWNSSVSSRI